jgi:hypothetical protein
MNRNMKYLKSDQVFDSKLFYTKIELFVNLKIDFISKTLEFEIIFENKINIFKD